MHSGAIDLADTPVTLKGQCGVYAITSSSLMEQGLYKIGMSRTDLYRRLNDYGLFFPTDQLIVIAILAITLKNKTIASRILKIEKGVRGQVGIPWGYRYRSAEHSEWVYDADRSPDVMVAKIHDSFRKMHDDLQQVPLLWLNLKSDTPQAPDQTALGIERIVQTRQVKGSTMFQVKYPGPTGPRRWLPELAVQDTTPYLLWNIEQEQGHAAMVLAKEKIDAAANRQKLQAIELRQARESLAAIREQDALERAKRLQQRSVRRRK